MSARASRISATFFAERSGVGGHVVNQQVGQCDRVCPHSGVYVRVAGKLSDQEDEPAQITLEPAFLGAVVEFTDAGVDLVQEDAGVDQARRQRIEQVARRDGGADGPVGDLLERVVEDSKLRAELALTAGGVHRLEARIPEAAPGAKQRVVEDAIMAVFGPRPETRALEVARHLARVGVEHLVDLLDRTRLLVQEDFSGHRRDVRIASTPP